MAILDDVKAALRVTTTDAGIVGEITDLINAAKSDLGLSGVLIVDDTEPLIKRAIITYAKANFGYDNPDAERLQRSYDMLKSHLTLSADYAFYAITFEVEDAVTSTAIRQATVEFDGQAKTTDATGKAVFYVHAGSNYKYTVTAEGYGADDDDSNLVDVAASQTVSISLTAI